MSSTHVTTTHDAATQATFSNKFPETPHEHIAPFGSLAIVYTNSSLPPDVSGEADLDQTKEHRVSNLPNHRVTVDDGVAAAIIKMKAGAISPAHRTRTLDLGVIVEGEVELWLDGDNMRKLKAGDTIVQRGSMHRWVNVTPNGGYLKMFFVSLDAKDINVAGKSLAEEWVF